MRVFGVLRYPTLQTKLEAQNMPDHCTPHVFYCLLCAVNYYQMKKHKILIEIKDYKEVEIEFPFYAYYQGELEEIFVKITKSEFRQITLRVTGECRLHCHKTNNYIASCWLENKSDWEKWQEAVRNAKYYVQSF